MTQEQTLHLIAYAFATSITPGPNNLMLMASGANYGVRRTLPHLLGVTLGFVILASALGAGLLEVLRGAPQIFEGLRYACMAFVLYLALRIATATPQGVEAQSRHTARPLHFLEAAAFQWINPKAVVMAITTVTTYTATHDVAGVLTAAVIFGAVNLPSCGLWVATGGRLRNWLSNGRVLRPFNITMALLLIASMVPALVTASAFGAELPQ